MNDTFERAMRTLVQSLLASLATFIGAVGLDITQFVDIDAAAATVASFVVALLASLVALAQAKLMPPKAEPGQEI